MEDRKKIQTGQKLKQKASVKIYRRNCRKENKAVCEHINAHERKDEKMYVLLEELENMRVEEWQQS